MVREEDKEGNNSLENLQFTVYSLPFNDISLTSSTSIATRPNESALSLVLAAHSVRE